jgi:hypothetical protein
LGIARGRQSNKPGWAAKKRRELNAARSDKPARKTPSRRAKPRKLKKGRRR